MQQVARRYTADLSVYLDPKGWTRLRYDVQGLPTACLIDAAGRLLGYVQGERDWLAAEVTAALTGLLPKSYSPTGNNGR